jgi:superfamily II DNA or RNA helicase
MATGSGKTFAALAAVTHVYRQLAEHERSLVVIVVCPFRHLVDQWAESAGTVGIRAICASGSRDTWMLALGAAMAAASANGIPFSFAVATDQAFGGDAFQAHLLPFRGHLLMIGDEVHDLGAPPCSGQVPGMDSAE